MECNPDDIPHVVRASRRRKSTMSVSAALRAQVNAHIDHLIRLANRDEEPPRPSRRPRPVDDDDDENAVYEERDVRPRTADDEDVGRASGRFLEEEEEEEDFAVNLQDLPDETLGDILLHRPILELMTLREVSYHFRRVIETVVFPNKKTVILSDLISESEMRRYRAAMPYLWNLRHVRVFRATRHPNHILENVFGGGYVGNKVETLEIIRFRLPNDTVQPLLETTLIQWFPNLTELRGHVPFAIEYDRLMQTPLRVIDLFPQDWPLTRIILETMPLSNRDLSGPPPYHTVKGSMALSIFSVLHVPPRGVVQRSSFPFQVRATNMPFPASSVPNAPGTISSFSLCMLNSQRDEGKFNLSHLPRNLRDLTLIWIDMDGHPTFEGDLPPNLETLQFFTLSASKSTNDFLKPLIRDIGGSLTHLAVTLTTLTGPRFDWFLDHVSRHATNLKRLGIYADGYFVSPIWTWDVSNVDPMENLEILELITPQLPTMQDYSNPTEDQSSSQRKIIFPNVRAFRSSTTGQGVPRFLPNVTRYEPVKPLSVFLTAALINRGDGHRTEPNAYPLLHSDNSPYRLWGISQPFSETWFGYGPANSMISYYTWSMVVATEEHLPIFPERLLILQAIADFAYMYFHMPRFSSEIPTSTLSRSIIPFVGAMGLRFFQHNHKAEEAFAQRPQTAEVPYERSLRPDPGIMVVGLTGQATPQSPSDIPQTLVEWRLFNEIRAAPIVNIFSTAVAKDYFRWIRNAELIWSINAKTPLLTQLGEDVSQFIASFGKGRVSVNLKDVTVPQKTLDAEMALILRHKRIGILSIAGTRNDRRFTFFPARNPLQDFRVNVLEYHAETLHQFASHEELRWSIGTFSIADSRFEGFSKRRRFPVTLAPFPEFKRIGPCKTLKIDLQDTTIAQCANFAAQNVKIFYDAPVKKFTFGSRNRGENKPLLLLSIPSVCKTATLRFLHLNKVLLEGEHPNLSSLILKRCEIDDGILLPKKDYPELAKLSFD